VVQRQHHGVTELHALGRVLIGVAEFVQGLAEALGGLDGFEIGVETVHELFHRGQPVAGEKLVQAGVGLRRKRQVIDESETHRVIVDFSVQAAEALRIAIALHADDVVFVLPRSSSTSAF
jgi:hypothetical protein